MRGIFRKKAETDHRLRRTLRERKNGQPKRKRVTFIRTMTTAEAREKLTQHGLSDDQAAGVVDVLERWERERVVTREYLDARLAEYYGKISDKLQEQTRWIVGAVILGVVLQHFWK